MIKESIVEARKFHEIWIEQCEAAEEINLRYGLKAAFDYLVAEKLFNFADAAKTHPAFARELPQFVARLRGLFTVEENVSSVIVMPTSRSATSSLKRMSKKTRSALKPPGKPRNELGNSLSSPNY